MKRWLVFGGRDYAGSVNILGFFVGPDDVVITGAARGADMLAWEWAVDNDVFWVLHPADWTQDGRAAGPIRNRKMAAQWQPEEAVRFGGGSGSDHMQAVCKAHKLRVWRAA